MGRAKLTDDEIRRRLQEGRNYKAMYMALKVKYDAVVAENKELRALVAAQQQTIASLQIQVAELQTMVFGKKRRPPANPAAAALPFPPAQPRDAASYRRPVPPAESVTATVTAALPDSCPHCGEAADFSAVTTADRYEEDIPLPGLTPGYQPHLVTKYVIARGRCTACGRAVAARELGGAETTLGPNVRLLVTDLISRMGLSYSQVSGLVLGLYGLMVSDGEIAGLLQKQHQAWTAAYGRLKADIRAAPVVHADETPWKIQAPDNSGYAWSMSDAASVDVCFLLASSRGARHAKQLFGQDTATPFAGVRISDDYGAYRNQLLPGRQQLCWAHLYRVIRDVAYNASLPEAQLSYVRQWYESFAAIYQDLRLYLSEPYDEVVRATQSTELWQRTEALAAQPAPPAGEPDKLRKLKAQLLRAGRDKLLVCLPADTPCDNNRAERDLRHLVLKRKRSFGSKTERGASALATILSLCTTAWRRAQTDNTPAGYFTRLAALAG